MGGQDHLVEALGPPAGARAKPHTCRLAMQFEHGLVQLDAVRERLAEAPNVFAAAAHHGAPDGAASDLQKPMVLAEPHKGGHRMATHLCRRRGPDGRSHGVEVVVAKRAAVAVGIQVVVERLVARDLRIARGLAVEPQQVAQHGPEAGARQVVLLREQAAQVGARVFEPASVQAHCERHVRGRGRHGQVLEQRGEVRVRGLVVDDEAGVHWHPAFPAWRVHGMAVAAQPGLALEHRDLVALGQQPGAGQARDAGADDGDALAAGHRSRHRQGGRRGEKRQHEEPLASLAALYAESGHLDYPRVAAMIRTPLPCV